MVETKVAIVTGSSSGIGSEIARTLSGKGFSVVVNSYANPQEGERLASELTNALHICADVSTDSGADHLVKSTIDHFGRLDVLVNNAGLTRVIPHADIKNATVEIWKEIFELNVFGSWRMIAASAPELQGTDRDSVIINVSSIAGNRPTGSSIPYAVSKAAIEHMTRLLAKALGPDVRVNAVAPGLVETPWTSSSDFFAGIAEQVRSITPLHRVGEPADVAGCVAYLVNARHVTGEVIRVDGGTHLI